MSVLKPEVKSLQKRRRKDFQGNFISSLPTARRVEFELKRELLGQRDGQPIWKWKSWLEECLRRMRFSLKYSTILNYEKILGKWVPKIGLKRSWGILKRRMFIISFLRICVQPPLTKKARCIKC